jgi:hypothetical protein
VKEIETSINIDAPADRVWAVVTDFAAYPEWNRFIRSLKGDAKVGSRLEVTLQPPGRRPMTIRPTVVKMEGRELRWLGRLGLPRVFDGRHSLKVEPLSPTLTRFTQYERFTGVLVPFFGKMLGDSRRGFEEMNRALKARAETPQPPGNGP